MGLPMEQAWEYEDPPLDTEQWMARMSFLLDPSISDQIFSSSTLLSLDTCLTFPGPKILALLSKVQTNPMLGSASNITSGLSREQCGSGIQPGSEALDMSLVLT